MQTTPKNQPRESISQQIKVLLGFVICCGCLILSLTTPAIAGAPGQALSKAELSQTNKAIALRYAKVRLGYTARLGKSLGRGSCSKYSTPLQQLSRTHCWIRGK
jgi:hypothetical protein